MAHTQFKTWVRKVVADLNELQNHDDYLEIKDICGRALRLTGNQATTLGLADAVERCANAEPNLTETRAALAFCLSLCQSNHDILTVAEASQKFSIPTRTIYALCEDSQLPHHCVGTGRGTIRITEADFETYLRQCRTEGPKGSTDYVFGSPDSP